MRNRIAVLLPLTVGIVALILYFNFGGFVQTLIVLAGVPFAAVGVIWLLYAMNVNTSVAAWVGMVALLGVAAETASGMVVYLDEAWATGLSSISDLCNAGAPSASALT